MLSRDEFLKGMAVLMAAYPDYEVKPATADVYFEDLQNLSPQEWEMAITLHRRQFKWFPKISELLGHVLTLRNQARPSAAERWGQLLELASRGAPAPTDIPTVRALSVVGGWHEFQFADLDQLNFRRKDFEKVYAEAMAEEDRGALLGLEQAGQPVKRLEG